MEKVWLASLYYVDPKLVGCSAATERMFTRLLAYCGNAENGGKMPAKVWTFVGLSNGKVAVLDLVSRGVLVALPDGGYEFPAWRGWQESGDKLAERRRKDRERKRAKRNGDGHVSAETSAEFRTTEERRGDKKTTSGQNAPHVSTATDTDEQPAERPTGPAIKPDAARMVREIIPRNQPDAVKSALRIKASEMLIAGTPPAIVEAALHEWMTRTDVGPGILPSLVSGLLKARDPRAAPKRALTKSERQFVELELMKDNPDPVALRQLGIDPTPTTNLRAINGGAQ